MTKKLVSGPILPLLPKFRPQIFFSCILSGPDVRYCCKLLLHVISSKTNGRNSEKRQKKPSFAPDFGPFGLNVDHYFFFKKGSCFVSHQISQSAIIMYHIRKKLMIQSILRKLSDDGRTEGQTDGQTDESDFIEHCPTNAKRPTTMITTKMI